MRERFGKRPPGKLGKRPQHPDSGGGRTEGNRSGNRSADRESKGGDPRGGGEWRGGGSRRERPPDRGMDLRRETESQQDRFPGAELLAGWHAVHEALLAGTRPIGKVLLSAGRGDSRAGTIARLARERGIPVQRVPAQVLERIAPRGAPHQGIVAEVAAKAYEDPDRLLETIGPNSLFLVLDEIQDPRNLGAILRSAAAVRADAAIVPVHRSAALTPHAARASAGGIEALPVARVANLTRFLEKLGEQGVYRVGLDPRANDLYTTLPPEGPLALVLGGEEKGLRPGIRGACDRLVRIPVPGPVGSLNVSVAAGIALYEVLRVRSGVRRGY